MAFQCMNCRGESFGKKRRSLAWLLLFPIGLIPLFIPKTVCLDCGKSV